MGDVGQNCTQTSELFVDAKDETIKTYFSFTSLSQLNFECDLRSLFQEYNKTEPFKISLIFNEMNLLNETIDVSSLKIFPNLNLVFLLKGIQGFDIEMGGPIFGFDSGLKVELIVFVSCNLYFYYRKSLVDEHLCSSGLLDEVDIKLFSGLSDRSILFDETSGFRNPICPYVFKNANIDALIVSGAEFDVINPHTFSFSSLTHVENQTVNLNCSIISLFFQKSNRLVLNHDVINPLVFGNILNLLAGGMLVSIQDGLFLTFKTIRSGKICIGEHANIFPLFSK